LCADNGQEVEKSQDTLENKLCKIMQDFWIRFKALTGDSIRRILEPGSNEESCQKDASVCISYFLTCPQCL
ncbi:MAG: hypothetical protein ACD_24C00427G0001, partial [uncultured bacterium]